MTKRKRQPTIGVRFAFPASEPQPARRFLVDRETGEVREIDPGEPASIPSHEEVSLDDLNKARIQQAAAMTKMDHAGLQEAGEAKLDELAGQLTEAEKARHNRAEANRERGEQAKAEALARYESWWTDRRRRAVLEGLSPVQRVKKYLKTGKLKARDRRKLNAMLKDGSIK
ncbi:MAG: hypothetical protein ACYDAE_23690 [Steroidobacteraceae bacterium]